MPSSQFTAFAGSGSVRGVIPSGAVLQAQRGISPGILLGEIPPAAEVRRSSG